MLKKYSRCSLILLAFLSPVIAVFAANLLTAFVILSSILPLISLWREKQLTHIFSLPTALIFCLFILYLLISAAWSIVPVKDIQLSIRIFLLFILGGGILVFLKNNPDSSFRKHLETSMILGTFLALLFLLIEIISHGFLSTMFHARETNYHFEPYYLNKGTTFIAAAAWVTIAILLRHRRFITGFCWWAATGIALYYLESTSALIAYSIATIAFLFIMAARHMGIKLLIAANILTILTIPFLMLTIDAPKMSDAWPQFPDSAKHRLYIWEYVSHKALEHPIIGWGGDSARHFPVDPKDIKHPIFYPLPNHPHDNLLHVWFELGIIGLLIFTGFISSVMNTVRKTHCPLYHKASGYACLITYQVIGMLSYSVWQFWWLTTALVVTCFFYASLQFMPVPKPEPVSKTP